MRAGCVRVSALTGTRHPEITFVVIHFSMRYSAEELRHFFAGVQLGNVVPWI